MAKGWIFWLVFTCIVASVLFFLTHYGGVGVPKNFTDRVVDGGVVYFYNYNSSGMVNESFVFVDGVKVVLE